MPIKGIFKREDRRTHPMSIYNKLDDIINDYCNKHGISRTEADNYALAKVYAPKLIKDFNNYKKTRRFSFPNRKRRK